MGAMPCLFFSINFLLNGRENRVGDYKIDGGGCTLQAEELKIKEHTYGFLTLCVCMSMYIYLTVVKFVFL